MGGRRLLAGGFGAAVVAGSLGIVGAGAAAADEARCLGYLHSRGFQPGAVHPSSYAIAEQGCEAGTSGAMIICTSLINLATEDHNAAHPDSAVDPWWACSLASWLSR